MNKQEELEQIDNNIRRLMLEATKVGGDTSILPELTVVTNYLSKNNAVSEKVKSTTEDEIKKRVKEAEKRRSSND